MSTQTVKSDFTAFEANDYRTDSIPLVGRIKQVICSLQVRAKQSRVSREHSFRAHQSQDVLRDLPVNDKLRLGLYHLMD